MKVIHILHELKFSGAEIMYVAAAPFFQKKGCDLTVVATAPLLGEFATEFEKAGFNVLHFPYPPLKLYHQRLRYYHKFIDLLKRGAYDVIHIHASRTMWGMAFCAWMAGCKAVYTFHNVFPTHWYSQPYHIFLRWSAKKLFKCTFQTISDGVYSNELKRFRNKTLKLNNWYDSNRFFPALFGEKEVVRKSLGINIDSLVIISVGGCSEIKRHHDILMALSIVLKTISDTVYLHVGTGDTEEDERKLAKELGINDAVYFVGNHREIRSFLIASDIYVMTSIREGMPITTIEAMACKLPAVLYDAPGLSDFKKNPKICVHVLEDPQKLANAIIDLNDSPSKRNDYSNAGAEFVRREFSINEAAASIYELYES